MIGCMQYIKANGCITCPVTSVSQLDLNEGRETHIYLTQAAQNSPAVSITVKQLSVGRRVVQKVPWMSEQLSLSANLSELSILKYAGVNSLRAKINLNVLNALISFLN